MNKLKQTTLKSEKMRNTMRAVALFVLLGAGLGQLAAQPLPAKGHGTREDDKGYVMDKYVNAEGNMLTLESYVTGKTIQQVTSLPTDIVLVLDVSGSMKPATAGQGKVPNNGSYINVFADFNYDKISNPFRFKISDYLEDAFSNSGYYYPMITETGTTYCEVKYVKNGSSSSTYQWMYFDHDDYRYYMKGTSLYKTTDKVAPSNTHTPVDVDGNQITGVIGSTGSSGPTIWSGKLAIISTLTEIYKISALKSAVYDFIDIVAKKCADDDVEHRISLVQFSNGLLYSGSSILTEFTHPENGYIGWNASNKTYLLKNFTKVDEAGAVELKRIVSNMWSGGSSRIDLAMDIANKLLSATDNPDYYNADHIHTVAVFTDGKMGNSDIKEDYANAAIYTTYGFKHREPDPFPVYSIGVYKEGDATDAEINFLNRLSSNYPNAQSLNDAATQENDTYAYKAENSSELADIFSHIAEETSVVKKEWGAQTVVQDVISEYFQLPEGTAGDGIEVFTADCTGKDLNDQLVFGESEPFAADVEVNGSTVRVSNFDFSANWCGNRSATEDQYSGKKLIITIPIEAKPGVTPGIHATNAPGSTIFPNGDEDNPADPFPTPLFYTKGETWVEAVTSAPEGWSLDNIDSAEDLAWLISYVCGYNGSDAHPCYGEVAKLTADVDMSAHIWVPIGGWGYCKNVQTPGGSDFHDSYPTNTDGFQGTFDGQGHVIRGMKSIDPITMPQGGMFGYVNHGTVMNTFVVGANFAAVVGDPENDPKLCTGTEGHFGIIADTLCNGGTIFNCEAEGIIMTYALRDNMYSDPTYGELYEDPERSYLGGLVGLVGRDKSGQASPATVHSCISVASLLGYHMAGCVNEIEANSEMKNCYSYTLFHSWMPTVTSSLGGLVATNAGKVQNCYLRDRADANVTVNGYFGTQHFTGTYKAVQAAGQGTKGDWHKGLLIGLNGGSATGIYVPKEWKDSPATDTDNSKVCFVGYGSNAAQGVGWFSDAVTPYYYKHNDTRVTMLASKEASSRLLPTLNGWLATQDGAGCTPWMRTTAAGINDDYPVLKIEGLESVASDDHVVLFYGDVNEMMSSRGLMTTGKGDDVVCLYENTDLSATNGSTTLYINEDVAVTQSAAGDVEAYVGITLDNSAGADGVNSDHGFDADAIDWHMFATSLSNAPVGINYNNDATPWPFSYGHPEDMPYYSFYSESEQDGYFPSRSFGIDGVGGTDYYREWDFYSWSEKDQHYINFKRNSASHWTEGYDLGGTLHSSITYANEEELVAGKGYMLAAATETFLQSHGKLNKGDVENETVTYTETPFCVGYNLIGNPYQSYLDFDEFASENDINTYAILDEDAGGYQTYTATETSRDGLRYINMHQGFFVKVDKGVTKVTFTDDMRSNDNATGSAFRGGEDKPYPFLKLTMTEGSGVRDYATVEFDRPQLGGGEKLMDLRVGDAQIYLHQGGTSYSTLFATSDIDEVALRFSTVSDGTYTLSWELSEGDFSEMYLIDNIAGQKVDMLSHGEYKFSGLASDYASRFRVVFSLDGSEGADAEAEPSETFAFQMGGSLVVNGTGAFQMFDVTGRLVGTAELTDVQNTLPMPQTQGIYVIRLANAGGVKVQKIVVR